jgi:hypothetical protein
MLPTTDIQKMQSFKPAEKSTPAACKLGANLNPETLNPYIPG